MQKSKLLAVFKVLDSGQLRALSDFVKSPFFNKKKEVLLLFEYLKKQSKLKFPAKNLSREVIFFEIFPKGPYNEKRMKYAMSDLLHLLHRYISITHFEADGIMSYYYRLDFFVENNLENDYRKDLRAARLSVEELPVSAERYQQIYLLEKIEEKHSHYELKRNDSSCLQKAMDSFDTFSFLKKLQYLCEILDREKVLPNIFNKFMIDEMEALILKNKHPENPLISIYRALFLLLRTDDEKYFKILNSQLNALLDSLLDSEAKALFYFAINYCIRQLRKGKKQFAEDLMDLYVAGVEGKHLLTKGEISPWTYKNMVQLGIGLKRYDWIELFIKDYSTLLPAADVEGAFYYNMAQLQYAKGHFEAAYKNLNLSEFRNVHYNVGAKILLLRMFYEEGEEDALFSLLSSFEIYLKRSKLLTGEFKNQYLHFVKTLYQIAKYGKNKREEIQKKLEKLKVVAERRWLQKMIDQL